MVVCTALVSLPAQAEPTLAGALTLVEHRVLPGERLPEVARRYGLSATELRNQAEAGGAHLEEIFLKVTGGEAMNDVIESLREAIEQ